MFYLKISYFVNIEYNNIMMQSFKIYLYKLFTKHVHCSQACYLLIIIKNTLSCINEKFEFSCIFNKYHVLNIFFMSNNELMQFIFFLFLNNNHT